MHQLTDRTRGEMWRLFSRFFEGGTRETFEQDLGEKQRVILLYDRGDGSLRGFSTVQSYTVQVAGRSIRIVYSGDTIIERGYWGQTALHRAFFLHGLREKLEHPAMPLYWFLITKGYKTYLLLSRNFREYWPRREQPTPEWQRQILDALARAKFGGAYRAAQGVIRFDDPHERLRDDVAPVTPDLLRDPDVRFFVEHNPGHARGDELCCLGRMDLVFAIVCSRRLLRRVLGRRP